MRNYNVIFYVFKKKPISCETFLKFVCVCVFFFQNQVTSRRRSVVTVRWSAETSGTFTPSSQDQPLYFVVIEINHDLEMSSIFCYIKIIPIALRNLIFVVLMGGMVEAIYRLKIIPLKGELYIKIRRKIRFMIIIFSP